jgi:Tol biopolymer transport system component
MSDLKALLERADRAVADVPLPADGLEGLQRRRDRKRRNQRIAAGVVGIVVFVAAVSIVTSVGSVDRTQTPAVPGGAETGPTPTPPAGTRRVPYLIDLNTGELTPLPTSFAPTGFANCGCGFKVSPDGTMVTYVALDDEGAGQVFIANLDGTDVQQVTHTRWTGPGIPDFPDWSPDGAAITYMSGVGDGQFRDIFVLDLATGVTSRVTNEKPPWMGAFPQFSPDGASIVYGVNRGGDGSGVRSVPVTGGKSTLLVGGGKNDVHASFPTFSPDGSALAVVCSGPRLEGICIADADGTNLRELVSVPPSVYLFGLEWSPDGTRIAYTIRATDNDSVFVVDVATGETTFVDEGRFDDWLDDHTLIIERTE